MDDGTNGRVRAQRERLVEQTREALDALEVERETIRQRHREELAVLKAEARTLRATLRTLEGKGRSGTRPARTAAKQAGPAAMARVRDVLTGGALTQAEIVRLTGLNDGTASYALRALVEEGTIRATGKRLNGSREFRLLRRRRAAA